MLDTSQLVNEDFLQRKRQHVQKQRIAEGEFRLQLVGFAKTKLLQPGESQTLQMTIAQRDLASFDEANSRWIADAGNYNFMVGANIADIRGTVQLKLTEYTEKTNNALAPKVKLNLLKKKGK